MSDNSSATRGYLIPLGAQPAEDADLDLIIQAVIAGITGLDGSLVRRKWQQLPPPRPEATVNWCAFAVSITSADVMPTMVHDGCDDDGQGTSTELRSETLEVLVSFYGPGCRSYAAGLRDGFAIGQNRDVLRAAGMAYAATDRVTLVPELTNSQFIRRADLVFRLRRMVSRTYAIRNVVSVKGTLVADQGSVTGL